MDLVHRISLEHFVLGYQTDGTFGEKYLVAELDLCAHFSPFDQVSVRLEDRIDFLCRGHLFAVEYTATRLVNHPRAEVAIMLDVRADAFDLHGSRQIWGAHCGGRLDGTCGPHYRLLGNFDQLPILLCLLVLSLARRHALNLIHAPMRGTRAIAKILDTRQFQGLGQLLDRARENPHHVPQEDVIGWMMNV
jgi:hypothetical protein